MNLTAGPELDRLIAEKVMGWQVWSTSCGCGGEKAWAKPRPSGAFEMVGCICHNDPPLYSFDITTAWRVVEELKRKGFDLIELSIETNPNRCVVAVYSPSELVASMAASTMPLAICLAALAAVEMAKEVAK